MQSYILRKGLKQTRNLSCPAISSSSSQNSEQTSTNLISIRKPQKGVRSFSTSTPKYFNWVKKDFRGEVTLVSYNVLSQTHLQNHDYLYNKVNKKFTSWDYRERLLREKFYNFIVGDNVNIFCLQEVDESKLETFYRPFFKEFGYKLIFCKRPDIDVSGEHSLRQKIQSFPDGSAIVFDERKFLKGRAEHCNFAYKSDNSQTNHFQYGDMQSNTDLNHSNVGILQKLTSKDTGKEFIIGTTHLAFNPLLGDLKLAQLMIWLHSLQKLSFNKKTGTFCPTILTGDMNVTPNSKIFTDFIINGFLDCRDLYCKEISGQLPEHSYKFFNSKRFNKKIAIPPIPKHLNIDYRDLSDIQAYETMAEADQKFAQKLKNSRPGIKDKKYFSTNPFENISYQMKHGDIGLAREERLYAKNLQNDIYHGSMDTAVGHKLNLKMPYVSIHERSHPDDRPYSTFCNHKKDPVLNPVLVDHVILSESVPVYNYLDVPRISRIFEDGHQCGSILGVDNPSDHMPVGVNFDIE